MGEPSAFEQAPLIVSARLDDASQRRLDALRRRHFPRDRNVLGAHFTLFHHLDPIDQPLISSLLESAAATLPLAATIAKPRNLGRGVAFSIDCPELITLRESIASQIPSPLTDQDRRWHWPHVTVQNKVSPEAARSLHHELTRSHIPTPAQITGLALWRYLGGPWEALETFGPAVSAPEETASG